MGTLELESVWKIYDNRFEAVKSISASVANGEFVSLLGPSGCGKTSTLRMIAGLEKISRGKIRIDGICVNELEPGDRNIAMAFESYALYPHLSVFENIAYPLRVRELPDAEIAKRVDTICESLGISQFKGQYPSALSGGVQQRTGLARALVRPASVYLLDEVLSHLDATERTMLRGEIRRVQKLMGLTALFVTHDQLEALAMSDKIMVINDGVLQQFGSPEDIYDRPENLFVAGFVGEPAMNTLRVERLGDDKLSIYGQQVQAKAIGLQELPEQSSFIIGARPKNIVIGESSRQNAIQGRVHTFEVLGDHTLASIELESGDLVFKIGEAGLRMTLDDPVSFTFESEKVLYFDPESTLRIKQGR